MLSGMQVGPLAKLASGSRTNQDITKAGAGLIRGPSYAKKLTAAAWSGTWPAPGSTLDLDFANNRGFVRGLGQGGVMDGITFTRASNGNYINEQGLLVGGGTGNQTGKNLLSFPQDFDNAAWGKGGATLTTKSVISPELINNGALLAETTEDVRHLIKQTVSLVAGQTYTFSIRVKSLQRTVVTLNVHGNSGSAYAAANFDLLNGVVSQTSALGVDYSVVDTSISYLSDGWYKCVITFTSAASTQLGIGLSNATTGIGSYGFVAYTGVVGNGLYIYGAQLEQGTEATEYFPTNINVPRFDWAGTATLPTNQLTASESFDNAVWDKAALAGISVSPDAAVAPNGTATADKLIPSTTSGGHLARQGVVGNDRTLSVYAKADGYNWIAIGGWAGNTYFDVLNGVVGINGLSNALITDEGDGWYRCSVYLGAQPVSGINIYVTNTNGSVSFSGNGTSGVLLWGAQVDIGSALLPYRATGAQIPTNTPLRPTATCNGLLIEEARTNRLLWCRDATQANWVKTNITAAKDQTGIDGVANAASSLLATADGGTCIQTIMLASGSRTGSVYLKRLTGTGIVQVSLDGSTWSTVDLSDTEWRRIVLSGTVTNPVVGIRLAVSGDAVAMDFGQVEDGAFATTPILTTGASATRAAEAATIVNRVLNDWFRQDEGTIITETVIDATGNAIRGICGLTGNGHLAYINGNRTVSAFKAIQINSVNTYTSGNKTATCYGKGSFSIFLAGGLPASGAWVYPYGAPPQIFSIGSLNGGAQFWANGCIKKISFFPKRLNDEALQELTR